MKYIIVIILIILMISYVYSINKNKINEYFTDINTQMYYKLIYTYDNNTRKEITKKKYLTYNDFNIQQELKNISKNIIDKLNENNIIYFYNTNFDNTMYIYLHTYDNDKIKKIFDITDIHKLNTYKKNPINNPDNEYIYLKILLFNNLDNLDYLDKIKSNKIEIKKPFLWVYWDDIDNNRPKYIDYCLESIRKNNKSFNLVELNKDNIYDYLNELKEEQNIDFYKKLNNLRIAHRVDYFRILLLYKYGGLYIDADTILLKDPIEIFNKTLDYDYIGFGCTGDKCTYGYGKPSNGIMCSRPNTKLLLNILVNLEYKIMIKNKFNYFDLGKFVIWDELQKLINNENYSYYHYSNHYDGTRDKYGHWVTMKRLYSSENIEYKNENELFFIILYNSESDSNMKNITKEELINNNSFIGRKLKNI